MTPSARTTPPVGRRRSSATPRAAADGTAADGTAAYGTEADGTAAYGTEAYGAEAYGAEADDPDAAGDGTEFGPTVVAGAGRRGRGGRERDAGTYLGAGRDGAGRDGAGRDSAGRDGAGRDGAGRDVGLMMRPAPARPRVTAVRLTRAVALSGLIGVLVAMLALPAVGVLGLTAKGGADDFLALPANLISPPLPQPSRIVDAQGGEIAVLRGEQDREVVPLSEVPQIMRQAIIDIEDARFYEHAGIDYRGLARAYFTNQESGEVTQGGSTLTQQYVKNVLLLAAATDEARVAATEQTVDRKLREARYALYLEEFLTKDEILERYLNIAYFGDGAYGIQAAAMHYFSVNARDLTLPQAALLAGLVKNPTAYNPALHPAAATERRNLVLDRMHQLGHVSAPDLAAARATPLVLMVPDRRADSCELSSAPYFCAYVRDTLLRDRTFGDTVQDRQRLLFEGGLTIRTTLDPVAQQAAATSTGAVIPVGDRVAASVAVVEPGTGRVLALTENRVYGPPADGKPPEQTTDSTHTKEIYPVDSDSFSAGSTFKAFALAAALEQGIPLTETYYAPACYHSTKFPNPEPNDCYGNADPNEAGFFSLTTATWHSVNTYYVQLAEKVGVLKIAEMARRLGVTSCRVEEHGSKDECEGVDGVGPVDGSFVLGTNEISTLDLATAYATFAARGMRCDPRLVESITRRVGTSDRDVPFSTGRGCQQVLDPKIADTVSAVLEGVVGPNGTGGSANIGRPVAGKTGTAQGFSTASFAGYIPQLAGAVTLADPRGPSRYPLRNVHGAPVVYGGGFPAQIWAGTMRGIVDGHNLTVLPLPTPDQTQPKVPTKRVPDVNGLAQTVAQDTLSAEGFRFRIQTVPSLSATSIVVGMTPSAGDEVPVNTEILLFVAAPLFSGDIFQPTDQQDQPPDQPNNPRDRPDRPRRPGQND